MQRLMTAATIAVAAIGAVAAPAAARSSDRAGTWEVVVGVRRTQAGADLLQARAAQKGLKTTVERDGRRSFEVEMDGFTSKSAARAERAKVRAAGFHNTFIEHS